jgi:hypothetical protein
VACAWLGFFALLLFVLTFVVVANDYDYTLDNLGDGLTVNLSGGDYPRGRWKYASNSVQPIEGVEHSSDDDAR